jgi:toxin-antitoxin system PIN domain toxin
VILVDANLLIYAGNESAAEHDVAREWLDEQLNGTTRVGLPWPSLLAFIRLATNSAVVRHPVTPSVAWRQVQEWLACEAVWIPQPGTRHADILGGLLQHPLVTSRLVPDAHLASIAIEHGLTLCSTDGDFAKFAGLKWRNPLVGER